MVQKRAANFCFLFDLRQIIRSKVTLMGILAVYIAGTATSFSKTSEVKNSEMEQKTATMLTSNFPKSKLMLPGYSRVIDIYLERTCFGNTWSNKLKNGITNKQQTV